MSCLRSCSAVRRWRSSAAATRSGGRAIFEGILRNYPKRLDLWSVYLDQVRGPRMHDR